MDYLHTYLRQLRANIEHDIKLKTYIDLGAREVPPGPLDDVGDDPFVKPIHQVIRQVAGEARGGDSVSAQVAAVNRKSRVIQDVQRTLSQADDPLILLGDPGTGKTMTMQQTALAFVDSGLNRVFPLIPLYVRLGEFHVAGDVTPDDVVNYVKHSAHDLDAPYIEALCEAKQRLVILFDGMDEMSRERYNEHTEALSRFAASRRGFTKTLFSCRITDFSPRFIHQRLVLLPFDRSQIAEFLSTYITAGFPIKIDDRDWTLKQLVKKLAHGALPMEANNPFVLWLLCAHLQNTASWPDSRVELLGSYLAENYRQKTEKLQQEDLPFEDMSEVFRGLGKFAYKITMRNQGTTIPVSMLHKGDPDSENYTKSLIHLGRLCGVLKESVDESKHLVRFEHHRFQEYFTALYLNEVKPPISWLTKLDAPRWQETMLNLILMGGGENAVRALADSISTLVFGKDTSVKEPDLIESPRLSGETDDFDYDSDDGIDERQLMRQLTRFSKGRDDLLPMKVQKVYLADHQETIISDRVELASRIVRQASATLSVKQALTPPLREAITFLAQNGNPITQVKMLRACQNMPDFNFLEALQKPLNSPIDWVRSQALMIIAGDQASGRAIGSDLATEIGYDLSNGSFPTRIVAYSKAIASAENANHWRSFLLGVFCYLATVTGLLGVASLLYLFTIRYSGFRDGHPWFGNRYCTLAFVIVVLSSLVVALKYDPRKLWALVLGSAAGSLTVMTLVLVAWGGSFKGLMGFIFAMYFLHFGLAALGAVVASGIIFSCLAVYLAGTSDLRGNNHPARAFFARAWQGCALHNVYLYSWKNNFISVLSILMVFVILHEKVPFVRKLLAPLVAGLKQIYYGGIHPLGLWAGNTLYFPFHPFNNFLALLAIALLVGALIFAVVTRRYDKFGWVSFFVVTFVVGGFVFRAIGFIFDWLISAIEKIGGFYLARAIAVIVFLAILLVFLFVCRTIFGVLRQFIRTARLFAPGTYTIDDWRKLIEKASPEQQNDILIKTTHQSLGITADEFLNTLKSVQQLIDQEPALSTYWSRRDQLEQVLRHERLG